MVKSKYIKEKNRYGNSNIPNLIQSTIKIDKFQYENDKTFVGRDEYIDKIKEKFNKSKIVSIIGIGGTGKTQLAYKALHKYQEEGLFDIVIPIYFGKGIPSFSGFLTDIAQKLEIPIQEFDKHNLDNKKVITYNELKKRKNPLLYLDNYEAISEKINKRKNDKTYEIPDNVRSIYLF